MDLGIKGRTAIVSAASKGLGRACAMSLAREGVAVTISSRSKERIEAAAKDIRDATGAKVTAIVADVATEEGRAAVLKACPDPDILINNAGGPPHGDFRQFTYEDWIKALDSNMLSAIFMIKGTVDGMIARKFGRIVNITSRGVKSPILNLPMSNGARAGLTGFVAGVERTVAKHNVTINGLLPGTFNSTSLLIGIAVTSPRRWDAFPNLPTLDEAGVKGFDVQSLNGVVAPAGTPPAIIARLNEAFAKAMSPEIRKRMSDGGLIPVTSTPEEYASLMRSELERWRPVMQKANLKLE